MILLTDTVHRSLNHARAAMKTGPDRGAWYLDAAGMTRGIIKVGEHLYWCDSHWATPGEIRDALETSRD